MYGSDGPGDKLFRMIPPLGRQREYDDTFSSLGMDNPNNVIPSPFTPLSVSIIMPQ
jgi:hypothetical protein